MNLHNSYGDRLREECGVFGVYGHPDAAALTALGLHALQHRGQEAAGIVSFDGKQFHAERRLGLVSDHFTKASILDRLQGNMACGHVRYSTTGETILRNVQPLFADLSGGGFAVAHNGNLTNALTLRNSLVRDGAIFQSTSDTETILQLVARSDRGNTLSRFTDALFQIEGAYALVVMTNKKLIGARDPLGIRPLFSASLTAIIFWPRKPARWTLLAHNLCVRSKMVRLLLSPKTAWKVSNPSPNLRHAPAFLNIFISRDPTALLTERAFMTAERHLAAN